MSVCQIKDMNSKVAITRCADYQEVNVAEAIQRLLNLLGMINQFIKPHYQVLIKPNLLSASLPEAGITTHPAVVREVAKRVKETGAKVMLGDSPGGPLNLEEVYEKTGMRRIAHELDIELVRFDRIEKMDGYPFAKIALDCDCLISLPKFKTHSIGLITAGLKNSFGLVPGIYKSDCHFHSPRPQDFAKVIIDVFSIRPPDLIIIDAVVSMEGEGPTAGTLRNTGLILGAQDAVSLDSILAKIIGINPLDIFATAEAYRRNLGEANLEKIELLGEPWESVVIKDFKLPRETLLNKLPRPALNLAVQFINTYPEVNNKTCRECAVCVKGCPVGAITIENGVTKIDHSQCIKCLCCYEFCPHNSIYLKKSLPMKLLGLVRR